MQRPENVIHSASDWKDSAINESETTNVRVKKGMPSRDQIG